MTTTTAAVPTGPATPGPDAVPLVSVRDLTVRFTTEEGIVDAVGVPFVPLPGSTEPIAGEEAPPLSAPRASEKEPQLKGVSFDIYPGEVLALVGESGSGKTVTSLAVIGLLASTAIVSGSITLKGEELLTAKASRMDEVRGQEISMIFQEPMTALNPTKTIGAQVAEVLTNHKKCDKAEAWRRAVELLRTVGIPEPERRAKGYPHELSGGQRQRVVIAIALACDPALIIADEPTTALDVTVQAEILDLIRKLAQELSTAFLLITHNMGVVADVAQRVAVMYRGEILEVGSVRDVLLDPQADYSRRLLEAVPKLPAARWDDIETHAAASSAVIDSTPTVGADKVPALAFTGTSIDYKTAKGLFRAADGVNLSIGQGEIVGLVGESGSGKSTLGRAALGLIPVSEGGIEVFGRPIRERTFVSRSERSARSQIGVVFQDPGSSLDPRMTIFECIAEPLVIHGYHGKRAGRRVRDARVAELLDAVELPRHYQYRYPHELSGGQRQRVGVARAIALDPGLLIADEPTSALDVSVQANVLAVMRALQEHYQFACLFISHDLAVVHSMSQRVAVMRAGKLVEVGTNAQVLEAPRHPYTRRLLAAAPTPDPIEQARRRVARHRLAEQALAEGTAAEAGIPAEVLQLEGLIEQVGREET